MTQLLTYMKYFCRDERGGEMVEAVLLIGAVILPLAFATWQVALMVASYYSQIGYVISLPFP